MKHRLIYEFLRDLKIPLNGDILIQVNRQYDPPEYAVRIYCKGFWLDHIHKEDALFCFEKTGIPTDTIAKLSADYRKKWVKTGPNTHYPRHLMEEKE